MRDGLDVIAQLRGTHPWVKVLAYSGGGSLRDFDLLTYAKEAGAHPHYKNRLVSLICSVRSMTGPI